MKTFLMSVLWVALFAGLGGMYWFQTTFDTRLIDMNERADAIEDKYQGFTDRIHNLEVKFIGRAKHVRQNQNGIKQLNEDLDDFKTMHKQDLYLVNSRIDSVGSVIDADRNNTEFQLESLRKANSSLKSLVTQNNITNKSQFNKINREISTVSASIEDIQADIDLLVERNKLKRE